MSLRAVVAGIAKRNLLATIRMPSIIAPSLIFPIFILISFTSGFTALTDLPNFPTDNFTSWYLPFAALQGSSFAGAGAGFSAARDIENGFFDRLLLSPGRRVGILLGGLSVGFVRSTITALVVIATGFALGARPAVDDPLQVLGGLAVIILGAWAVATMAGLWSLGVAYRLKTERAAPLFFIVVFMALFLSTAQVPIDLMNSGWLQAIARWNPITYLLRFVRQGFVTPFSWADTWPGVVTVTAVLGLLFLWTWRALARYEK